MGSCSWRYSQPLDWVHAMDSLVLLWDFTALGTSNSTLNFIGSCIISLHNDTERVSWTQRHRTCVVIMSSCSWQYVSPSAWPASPASKMALGCQTLISSMVSTILVSTLWISPVLLPHRLPHCLILKLESAFPSWHSKEMGSLPISLLTNPNNFYNIWWAFKLLHPAPIACVDLGDSVNVVLTCSALDPSEQHKPHPILTWPKLTMRFIWWSQVSILQSQLYIQTLSSYMFGWSIPSYCRWKFPSIIWLDLSLPEWKVYAASSHIISNIQSANPRFPLHSQWCINSFSSMILVHKSIRTWNTS